MFRRPVKSWAYLAILCIVGGTKMTPSKRLGQRGRRVLRQYRNGHVLQSHHRQRYHDAHWLSKTKMKHRGYVEKTETDLTVNPFLELMKAATSDDKPQK